MGFRPLLPEEEMQTTAPVTFNFRPITDDEVTPTSLNILGNAWQGIKDTPSNFIQGIKSIPSGISSLYEAITSPVDSIKSGNTENALRGIGSIASATGGAGLGASAGLPLAPFTLGLSVPVGAALGGALGLFGFDKANQLVGNDPVTSLSEDVNKLAYNTAQNISGNVLTKGISKGVGFASRLPTKIVENLVNKSDELKERALGVQYGERVKSLGRNALYADEQGNILPREQLADAVSVDAPIQQQIKLLNEKGILSRAPDDAADLKIYLEKNKNAVGLQIRDLMKQADQASDSSANIIPKFTKTREFINSYRDTTKANLEKTFKSILQDYNKESGGGFGKLAKFTDKLQKETDFDQLTPKEQTILKRIIQYEFRKKSENIFDQVMPEQKGLFSEANQIYSALESVNKTINKRLAKPAPSYLDYVKGGSLPAFMIGAPAAASFGYGPGAVIAGGTLLGNALRMGLENKKPLSMSSVYNKVANGITSPSEALSATVGVPSDILSKNSKYAGIVPSIQGNLTSKDTQKKQQRVQAQGRQENSKTKKVKQLQSPMQQDQRLPLEEQGLYTQYPSLNPASYTDPNQVKKLIEQQHPLIRAVAQVESGGNPRAVSPAGAQGLMQLMPGTAKEVGVRNTLNPEESIQGGTQYLIQNLEKFKDVNLALAGYNAGPARVDKAIKATIKAGERVTWVNIQKRLPQETRDYVRKVKSIYTRYI